MMTVAEDRDWEAFMALAAREGWRVPQSEIELHRQRRCGYAWAIRREDETIGLVTAVLHRKSAWIGNLIITPERRGEGLGTLLFTHAVKEMHSCGATTLWLTASKQGAPLYAARGFQQVGEIERWVRPQGGDGKDPAVRTSIFSDGRDLDLHIWGDDRSPLLSCIERTGEWQQYGESMALLQRDAEMQIIGPWYGSARLQDDALLLQHLLSVASTEQEVVIDLLSSSGRQGLLSSAGFSLNGTTTLMVSGPTLVKWPQLISLATLGSCG